jgi:predicted alpha/beta superfamily hydrolase
MIQAYRNMGINDGFSAAGVSFDYRRYIHSHKLFETSFEYEVNRLYRNTGKPCIIITHSLGGLLVYNELLKISPKLKKKLKLLFL